MRACSNMRLFNLRSYFGLGFPVEREAMVHQHVHGGVYLEEHGDNLPGKAKVLQVQSQWQRRSQGQTFRQRQKVSHPA